MSFREKHLWISIVATIGVWGFYCWRMAVLIADGALMRQGFAATMGGLFVGCLVISVVVEIILTLIATWTTPKAERETRDERETLAALKASHVALMALIALVILQSGAAYLGALASPAFGTHIAATPANALVLLANILLASVIVAEMIRAGLTLALLRRLR
jgi:hypothetical protein